MIESVQPVVEITSRAAQQIQRGMLWVFSNEIILKPSVSSGSWVTFFSSGQPVGIGYFNSHSLIAGRVLSQNISTSVEELLTARLRVACRRRRHLISGGSCRLVFSEADLIPGVIVDWYSGVVVLQSTTAGIDAVLPFLEKNVPLIIERELDVKVLGFVIRADSNIRTLENIELFNRVVLGDEKTLRNGKFFESNVQYAANFFDGQKTGFFLDQRDNRAHLEKTIRMGEKQSVLDLFCYSGGWGLRALYAGAKHVTFVDQSMEALEQVRRGLELNRFSSDSSAFVEKDVFDFLKEDSHQYDVVVADPPAFVKSKKVLPQAKKAYEKLLRQAWQKVKNSGILYFCSCSYHLSLQEFSELVGDALGREKALAHVIYHGGQAEDHPILLSMPETNYLKCVALKKL